MKQLKICFVLIASAAGLLGCSSNCKDRGECECITRFDCENEEQICVGGKCIDNDTSIWLIPERKFGEVCIAHRECIDGVCLPMGPDNGGVCTTKCESEEDCQEDWTCQTWTGNADIAERVCVQKTASKLCMPCAVDGHCQATGDLCIETEDGHVCAQDCASSECPLGYECKPVEHENGTFSQCVPLDNSCECGPGKEGMGKACTNTNDFGVCAGWSYCTNNDGTYEWSECDAQMPALEICNGMDDDCDGLIDNLDPSLSHDELGADGELYPICYLGGCVGRWQCRQDDEENYVWMCDATDPQREICNGADDNCNGEVDEIFKNEDGLYVDEDNCGTCGTSCRSMLSDLKKDSDGNVIDGAASCEIRDGEPVCVPKQCADGYYPYPHENPISCLKLESPACEVCGSDNDCHVYSDRCLPLEGDFGTHCLQSCDESSPYHCNGAIGGQSCCPDGFTCKRYLDGKWCIPKGQSCTCDATKLGMVRNCAASSGTDVCQGRQTCLEEDKNVYAWSECSAEDITQEVCDGQDNNCDGNIDEDFIDEQGRYNADEHCGKCNNDCPSHWKAPELHATGACLLTGDEYSCQFTGCKEEDAILGKRCNQDSECGADMKCDPQVFYCVSQSGETQSVSCSTDDDCSRALDRTHKCISGVCKVHILYHDVNQIAADGCECGEATNVGWDYPDSFDSYPTELNKYIDRNCDGIDGELSSALFVSAQSTQSLGTRENPYATISEAIAVFNPSKHSAILVAAGIYLEQVVIKSGVQIYGGYSSDFSTRNIVLYPTQISAPPTVSDEKPGSVYIPAVSKQTVVNGFTIMGYDADESMVSTGSNGRNSYAIYIAEASSYISITNNDIHAGRAGNGGRGAAGESGYAGDMGENGLNSRECRDTTCYGETTKGGKGGTNSYCTKANGRDGATAKDGNQTQDFYSGGRDGLGGANNYYSHSYPEQYPYCKYDCVSGGYANGGNGANGSNGQTGSIGKGCSNNVGKLVNSQWVGNRGTNGSNGEAAYGGGGGGAGGGAVNYNDSTCYIGELRGDLGGSGGGGGAGGCGGTGGAAGGAGGGSFGIWIASSQSNANINANKIQLGFGGNGGNGGDGGAGGRGARGGIGGRNPSPAWCAGAGGTGGNGGDGGAGAGGGGGCGGISVGIAGMKIDTNYQSKNDFNYPEGGQEAAAGKGGLGGGSPAGNSAYGESGIKGHTAFVESF